MLLELLYFSFSIRHFQLWWRFCCCDVTCFFNVLLLSFYCYRLYVNCANHFDKKNMDIYSKFFPSCYRIYSEFTLAKTLKHLQYTTSKTLFHQQSGRLLKKVPKGLSTQIQTRIFAIGAWSSTMYYSVTESGRPIKVLFNFLLLTAFLMKPLFQYHRHLTEISARTSG